MLTALDQQHVRRNRPARPPAALGRWSRDPRSPARRLTPREITPPAPDFTQQFAVVAVPSETEPIAQPVALPLRTGRPIAKREDPCPYLEQGSAGNRCMSARPVPVSPQRKARRCLTPAHHNCRNYRDARKSALIPPAEAAFYTSAVAFLMLVVAMLQVL